MFHSSGRRGVYDPGLLKAVFLAGGPGSGKSFVARIVFAIGAGGVTPSGLKLINSDPAFERQLAKVGVRPADLAQIAHRDPEWYYALTGPAGPRARGKQITEAQKAGYLRGRLGLIIDGTGRELRKISRQRAQLQALGYDTSMLFVNTSLQVALERNAARSRKLPPGQVRQHWQAVQENIGGFQALFGPAAFFLVDNSRPVPPNGNLLRAVQAWVQSPVQNPIGRAWIAQELAAKDRRGRLALFLRPPPLPPIPQIPRRGRRDEYDDDDDDEPKSCEVCGHWPEDRPSGWEEYGRLCMDCQRMYPEPDPDDW